MAFVNVILVCDSRKTKDNKDKPEHWKSDIPDFDEEVIRNFYLLGTHNGKDIYHCLIDDEFQLPIIKQKVKDKVKPIKDKLKSTSKQVKYLYKEFMDDSDTLEYAEQVMKYPVIKETDEGNATVLVSVAEAKAQGEIIDENEIKIPHQFMGF